MKRAAKSKRREFDPFEKLPEVCVGDSVLAIMLRDVLLATRVRSVAGYKPFRCYACDYPHVNGTCRGNCVHHKAVELLKEMGVEGLENLQ